jgi:hypothetical protein
MRRLLIFGALFVSMPLRAQASPPAFTCTPDWISDFTQTASVPPLGRVFVEGQLIWIGQKNGLTVVAAPRQFDKYLAVRVHVFNDTDTALNILPNQICAFDFNDYKAKRAADSDEIARKVGRPNWRQRFAEGAARSLEQSSATNTTTSTTDQAGAMAAMDNYGNVGVGVYEAQTTTESHGCDAGCVEWQRQIAEKYARLDQQRVRTAQSLSDAALRSHTLLPGADKSGLVFIADLKRKQVSNLPTKRKVWFVNLYVPIGGEVFRFPIIIEEPK